MQADENTSILYFPKKLPTIVTKRLIMRPLTKEDGPNYVLGISDIEVCNSLSTYPYPYTIEDYNQFYAQTLDQFSKKEAIVLALALNAEPNMLIGRLILRLNPKNENAEAGYWLRRSDWNKGYMTEALKGLIDYGFNALHFHKISGCHYEFNKASAKVMQKCGMIKEMTKIDHVKRFDKYQNLVCYGIINPQYIISKE